MKALIAVILTFTIFSCAQAKRDLPTAQDVEIGRYIGKWYAVKALPQFFSRNCKGQIADYEVIDDKTISVVNTCLNGKKTKTISGKAVVKNSTTNAELEVSFNNFWTRLFRVKGEYIIIKLDPNYEYSLVGTRNRKSLWILSRRPIMAEADLAEYEAYAKSLGFAVEKLVPSEF